VRRLVYLAFFGQPLRASAASDVLYCILLKKAQPTEEIEQIDTEEIEQMDTEEMEQIDTEEIEQIDVTEELELYT
jgi:hypothetical protein